MGDCRITKKADTGAKTPTGSTTGRTRRRERIAVCSPFLSVLAALVAALDDAVVPLVREENSVTRSLLEERVCLLLVTTAHPQSLEHAGPGFGRLVQPRHYGRIADTAAAGIPWAADNDCFQGLDARAYRLMLDAIRGLPGCLFVTVPDVVADAQATLALWHEWKTEVAARSGQPRAFVLQDGITPPFVPWDELAAVFVGGSTEWKLGAEAEALVCEARARGKHVHMGRVNSRRRYDYARAIGCGSVDGTSFARWRNTWLPAALRWHREPLQERLSVVELVA